MRFLDYERAIKKIREILSTEGKSKVLEDVVIFLFQNFGKYSWVGIYFVEGNDLVLGPWNGPHATEHTRIPIGKGICGAAASLGKTEIVDDVKKDKRYIACFLSTRSEIVVPIIKNDKIVGEIDIDSEKIAAFTRNDELFLKKIAILISKFF